MKLLFTQWKPQNHIITLSKNWPWLNLTMDTSLLHDYWRNNIDAVCMGSPENDYYYYLQKS